MAGRGGDRGGASGRRPDRCRLRRGPAATLEGGFHSGLATSAYVRGARPSITDAGAGRKKAGATGPRPGWCSYARRAGRPRRWGGSTSKARATSLDVLLRIGSPRSAFRAVVFEIPAAARSRLVIPRSSRRVFTRSGYSSTYALSPLVDGRTVWPLGEAGGPRG